MILGGGWKGDGTNGSITLDQSCWQLRTCVTEYGRKIVNTAVQCSCYYISVLVFIFYSFKHQNQVTKFDLMIHTEKSFSHGLRGKMQNFAVELWVSLQLLNGVAWNTLLKLKMLKNWKLFGMENSWVPQFLWNTSYKFGEGLVIEPESISSLKM